MAYTSYATFPNLRHGHKQASQFLVTHVRIGLQSFGIEEAGMEEWRSQDFLLLGWDMTRNKRTPKLEASFQRSVPLLAFVHLIGILQHWTESLIRVLHVSGHLLGLSTKARQQDSTQVIPTPGVVYLSRFHWPNEVDFAVTASTSAPCGFFSPRSSCKAHVLRLGLRQKTASCMKTFPPWNVSSSQRTRRPKPGHLLCFCGVSRSELLHLSWAGVPAPVVDTKCAKSSSCRVVCSEGLSAQFRNQ